LLKYRSFDFAHAYFLNHHRKELNYSNYQTYTSRSTELIATAPSEANGDDGLNISDAESKEGMTDIMEDTVTLNGQTTTDQTGLMLGCQQTI
jgi:hypothetical protein